ncbi:FAD-dependent oxidoreductase [Chthonobacter albigriseus]|uniref:oxidoreductase n=1 Tax=Chthonobacter albigriseus TaxID=1683161 RepID=UPI0015EEEEC5|nr:FAD-dependent oxidoreductase [Chthonobacter albigriseus]
MNAPVTTARDPRYDILFEPVKLGPKVTKNRFYQVPHCNGLGYRDPTAAAVMRGIKAEGGWGVVCTEQVEFHHTSEITPFIELRLWDERDIPVLARMAEHIHAHDALAGVELAYNGMNGPNLYSREVPMGPSHLPVMTFTYDPVQSRRMDLEDIRNLRRWHQTAVRRAKTAGFDIIYVYAAHTFGFLHHFLSRRFNDRTDEYGGSIKNRVRLLKEVIEDSLEAAGGDCAIPVRISVDELLGEAGLHKDEVEEMIGEIADLPDFWDLTLSGWDNDSRTSRFAEEGHEEPFISGIKKLTGKPVVGVGRYTSVDRMVSLVKKGILDLIGCARPSIADPFLPAKVNEGRIEDIRECIGCNICVSGDLTMSPIRCTQNPTMAEEWRRGWHPEKVRPARSQEPVLIVGAGPAGLEAATVLGKRGYPVTLAEAGTVLGGRVVRESRLPGLAAWIRVRDYRQGQLTKLPNVEIYFDSKLTADDVLGFGFPRVLIATGATWRRDGIGHQHTTVLPPLERGGDILTPDDIMDGCLPNGRTVIVWDDDHYYMGSVVAEKLATEGYVVHYVTPAPEAATWTRATMEQTFIQRRMLEAGIRITVARTLAAYGNREATLRCIYTGREETCPADSLVLVTARLPNAGLADELRTSKSIWLSKGLRDVQVIADALAPATIAHATYAGRKYAEELDAPIASDEVPPFLREITQLA